MPAELTPGRVRDPVHGYVSFTGIERVLLDHPVAQRLRHVGQSAAAHLVFPEMRVSRFSHSLGAMHLASRFLDASLRNAPDDERDLISTGFQALVQKHAQMGVSCEPLRGQGLKCAGLLGSASDRTELVEQGLRLASLLHDLGHLPFSHDFEMGLEHYLRGDAAASTRYAALLEQGPGGDAVHERVGYALATLVQQAVFRERLEGTPLGKVAEVALLIARDILNAPAAPTLSDDPADMVLSWLHGLVAGEVDVDRADYVLRDVRHYGLTAAGYDLDRLVDNLVPIRRDGELQTALLPQGVSAAEGFLVARFRMYTWAVYHHKIQQASAGLRIAIEDLLADGSPAVREFLTDITAIAGGTATADVLDRFVGYDDVWWMGLLRDRISAAPSHVRPWLELFVRRSPGPASLWKRPSDFPVEDRAGWNRSLPHRTKDVGGLAMWDEKVSDLRNQGIVVVHLPFKPWRADNSGESRLAVRVGNDLVPLTKLTSLVRALDGAWDNELQVLAFSAEAAPSMEPDAVLQHLDPALIKET